MNMTEGSPFWAAAIAIFAIAIIFYYAISKKTQDRENNPAPNAPAEDPYKPDRFDERCQEAEPVKPIHTDRNVEDNTDDYEEYFCTADVQEWNSLEIIRTMIQKFLNEQNFERASALFTEAIVTVDRERSAINRHFFTIKIIEDYYAMRDIDPISLQYCLWLCDIDMENADCLFSQMKPPFDMVSPTRKAIILERNMDYAGAIEVCNWALERDLLDSGKKSFLGRKARLEKKLAKQLEY